MGGSSGGTTSQVVDPGGPIRTPFGDFLERLSSTMLNSADGFSKYGTGANIMPNVTMGQVYVPGPNQTIYGNPYNTQQQAAGFWGQSAVPNSQAMYNNFLHPGGGGYNYGSAVGQGTGQGGGWSQGGSGGNVQQQGGGNAITQPSVNPFGKLTQQFPNVGGNNGA